MTNYQRYQDFPQRVANFSDLVGKTLTKVYEDKDKLIFDVDDGTQYALYHAQECCEYVRLEDTNGDLEDLVGTPILSAYESSNELGYCEPTEDMKKGWGTGTWTFYRISTIKGTVVLRWLGESNGYYSESVDFARTK